jgi:polysaccharide export outer membrane protein
MACLLAAVGLTLCSSCSTPPAPDDGLVGIIYHAAARPDAVSMAGRGGREDAAQVQPDGVVSPATAPTGPAGAVTNGPAYEPPAYRISPGDVLAVSYFTRPPSETKEYLVESQDVLAISIAGQESYAADVVVRPDGCLSFYQIGELRVRGLTVAQVRAEVAARMSKVMPGADITVILKEANGLVRDFLNTLRSADQGSTRVIHVRHDGAVTFPLVGETTAMGKTLSELSREIEARYDEIFRGGISVAFNLNSSADGNIAVLGEVRNPGRYTIGNPISPFFALAMAGGALDTAKKSQVVVVKRQPGGRVAWYAVNLDLDSGRPLGPEIALAPQDMLLVPKTGIANLNVFVDQYIRRLMPMGASYSTDNWTLWGPK